MSGAPDAWRGAVFFDRDGTLIEDEHYLADPARVRLRPHAAAAVRRATAAGLAAVVVTNQSGIARGKLTEADHIAVTARLDELLAAAGARLVATYHCPHHPDVTGPCDCRKPGVGLYERAAAELGIDLARSAYVGDRIRDVVAAARFGGLGVLVPSRETSAADMHRARDEFALATSLEPAMDRIIARLG